MEEKRKYGRKQEEKYGEEIKEKNNNVPFYALKALSGLNKLNSFCVLIFYVIKKYGKNIV